MATATAIGIGLAIAIGIGNLAVSVALLRSRFYSRLQKLAQLAIIWFIPLFGAVGIWAFLRAQHNWEKFNTRAFPEGSQKGVAVEVQSAIHSSLGGGGGAPD
jgi:hypothetical protein